MSVPILNIWLDHTNMQETLRNVVKEIRPDWKEENIVCENMSTGYINMNYKVYEKDQGDPFVMRIINTTFDTTFAEGYKKISILLHETELSPKLLAVLDNGICQDYVHGTSLSWEKTHILYEEDVWKKTCEAMARYHSEYVLAKADETGHEIFDKLKLEPEPQISVMFDLIKTNQTVSAECRGKAPTSREWNDARIWYLTYMKQINATRALCHMDANPSNVILQEDKAVLVDYDVTGINYMATDIAWYFLCHCNFREFYLSDYPSPDHQEKWLRHYLTYRHSVDGYIHKFTYPIKEEASESAEFASIENSVRNLQKEVDIGRLGAYVQASAAAAFILNMKQKDGDEALDENLFDCWEAFQKLRAELEISGDTAE